MNKNIKKLLETYFNSYDQMTNLLKNNDKDIKKNEKEYLKNKDFVVNVLGKQTFNKFNKELFAPIPMSALHITFEDLYYTFINNIAKNHIIEDAAGVERTFKLLDELKKYYTRNELKFVDNGYSYNFNTNIIFKTFNDIVNFLVIVQKAVKKVSKRDDNISWKPLVKKFRNYVK